MIVPDRGFQQIGDIFSPKPNCAPMGMSVTVCHTRTRCASEPMSRPGPRWCVGLAWGGAQIGIAASGTKRAIGHSALFRIAGWCCGICSIRLDCRCGRNIRRRSSQTSRSGSAARECSGEVCDILSVCHGTELEEPAQRNRNSPPTVRPCQTMCPKSASTTTPAG
jgi:hypothetical protein